MEPTPPAGKGKAASHSLVLYGAMLLAAAMVFALIRSVGEGWWPVGAMPREPHSSGGQFQMVPRVLAVLAAIVALGNLLRVLFQRLGQPAVIGEVVAGICLGPSVLGAVWPEAMHWLVPPAAVDVRGEVREALEIVSQLGVVLYMFVVGLELHAASLKGRAAAAVLISHVSIVVPFLLGSGLALWLYRAYAPTGVGFTSFALFMGVAMSITAFPVLARILADRGMQNSPLGVLALACAAADDATAWCLLAVVVGVVKSQAASGVLVVLGAAGFVAVMLLLVRPVVIRWSDRLEAAGSPIGAGALAVGLVGVLLSALTAEAIGVHAIFGAFLFGSIIPTGSRIADELQSRFKDSVTIVMLPAFFALTGLRTRIGLLSGVEEWLACAVIIAVATAGKFGGTYAAARAIGSSRRDAATLGTLMNTRGLMELIVLNLGLELGVISPTLFAMMVLMALATTMMTGPVLNRLSPAV